MLSEQFDTTNLEDPAHPFIEAWEYKDGKRDGFKGSLDYWVSDDRIQIGNVATELPFQRTGVASRLFAELRARHPTVTKYAATVASAEGSALFAYLRLQHSDVIFSLIDEDGTIVSAIPPFHAR